MSSVFLAVAAAIGGVAVGFLATTPQERAYVRWPLAVIVVACLICGTIVAVAG